MPETQCFQASYNFYLLFEFFADSLAFKERKLAFCWLIIVIIVIRMTTKNANTAYQYTLDI